MSRDTRSIRLFVDQDLADGGAFALEPDQAHYLRNVMRRSEGDALRLFNGRDGEWSAAMSYDGKRGVAVSLGRHLRPQTPPRDLALLFAPLKKARTDFLIEKATELGVSRFLPVTTRHAETARVNVGRLRATAVEAAEQCERLEIPEFEPLRPLPEVLADWPQDRPLLLCAERTDAPPIADVLENGKKSAFSLLIGPEGGFASDELDQIAALPFVTATSLGPRILRAETAVVAALAVMQAVAGDW